MKPEGGPDLGETLADRFAALWDSRREPPDLSSFLQAHPEATIDQRLDVVRLDRHRHRQAGTERPLDQYLRVLPESAAVSLLFETLRVEDPRAPQAALEFTLELDPIAADSSCTRTEVSRLSSTADQPAANAPGPSQAGDTRTAPAFPTDADLHYTTRDQDPTQCADDSLDELRHAERFEIRRRLGTGGMGVVYEAFDRDRGQTIALKTMRRADPKALYRFKQEFRGLADLTHPNLVTLYELFAVGDFWFFTMELIAGTDFSSYVRHGPPKSGDEPPADETAEARAGRLRKALHQLVAAVAAIHDAGKIHRDIKPSNVMVTAEGRVVVLDFGVSTELKQSGLPASTDDQIVGTVAYMAPEQGTGHSLDPACDWYSVGVVLYEAMTGSVPFQGQLLDVLKAKQEVDPPAPSARVPGVPPDLEALCMELLRRDPAGRPSGREFLARLQGAVPPPRAGAGTTATHAATPLIGRERHLGALRAAFDAVHQGGPVIVHVFGRSGTGKSALVQSFLDEVVAADEAIVLAGRCHERESVPYKALDRVVDALSRYLARLGTDEARPLLPADLPLLARVFPVLQRNIKDDGESRPPVEPQDRPLLRRRAFGALRSLLARLSDETPLIVAIDDLQWGDAEDAGLLFDLLRPPDAPRLLFVGSYRTEDAESSPLLKALRASPAWEEPGLAHRELAVESLSQSEARELALEFFGSDLAVARAEAHLIARESHGNPLFISELVRHVQGCGGLPERPPSAGELSLDEVLWERVAGLPEAAQRLLEVVSVSGRSIHPLDAGQASGLGAEARAAALAVLRAARLIRATGPGQGERVEVYHNRIRDTVLAHLAPGVVAEHHLRLAETLAAGDARAEADAEALAGHYLGAGQYEKAGSYYARAADKAWDELAFLHAARLYRQAIEHLTSDPGESRRLRARLGDALASAGRAVESARAYLDAAAVAAGSDTLDLKRRAAMQFLIGGQIDEGLETLHAVLAAMGMAVPATPRRVLLSLGLSRALLRVHSLGFRRRDEREVPVDELTRIDVCWSAVVGLSIIDPIRGADFQARGLLRALRAGEPYRIARALAMEAAHVSLAGSRAPRRLGRLLETAERLAADIAHPHALAMTALARATAQLMIGRWAEAREALDRAEETFRERCTGVAWELDAVTNLALRALTSQGDLVELRRLWPARLKEARARGEPYALTTMGTYYATLLRLADNDPEAARVELEAVTAGPARQGFHVQHSTAFRSRVLILLYQERWDEAWDEVRRHWPAFEQSMLLRVQMIRVELLELRARCALAAAVAAAGPGSLTRSAERDARRLEREGLPWAQAHAQLVRAGLALARRDAGAALALLADAARRYQAEGMRLEAAVARRRLGELLPSAQGVDLVREADDWLSEQGVRDPERFAAMLTPGLGGSAELRTQLVPRTVPPNAREARRGPGRS